MKKSLLFVLSIPLLLVGCKANNSGGNGNGGGGNTSADLGPTIAPADTKAAFLEAVQREGRSFEYTMKNCDNDDEEYITIGCLYFDASNYNIYYIDSVKYGTGWDNYDYNISVDVYDSGSFAEGQHWAKGDEQLTRVPNEVAMPVVQRLAYADQSLVPQTTTKVDATVLGHLCDKYTVSYYGESASFYVSQSLGFTLQSEYNAEGEHEYITQLMAITLGDTPMINVFG